MTRLSAVRQTLTGTDGAAHSGRILLRRTLASRVALQVLTFCYNISVARLLGPAGKGVIALAMLWSLFAASVAAMGLEVGLTYFASKRRANWRGLAIRAASYSIVIGGTVAITLELFGFRFSHEATPAVSAIVAALIPVQLCLLLMSAVFIGAGRLSYINWSQLLVWAANLLMLPPLFVTGQGQVTAVLVVYFICQCAGIAMLVGGLPSAGLRREHDEALSWAAVLDYSLRAFPGSLGGMLQLSGAGLILGYVSRAEEVGIYSVAYSIVAALYALPIVVGTVLLPSAASLSHQEAARSAAFVARASAVGAAMLTLAACVIVWLAVPTIFGEDFTGATRVFLVLGPSAVAFSVARPLMIYFQAVGRPGVPSLCSLTALVVVCAAGFPLAQKYGATGAAAALTCGVIVGSVMLVVWFGLDARIPARALLPQRSEMLRIVNMGLTCPKG